MVDMKQTGMVHLRHSLKNQTHITPVYLQEHVFCSELCNFYFSLKGMMPIALSKIMFYSMAIVYSK